MRSYNRVCRAIALLLALPGSAALAQNVAETGAQIEALKRQISQLEQQVDAELGDRQSLQRELRASDRQIAALSLQKKDLQLRMRALKTKAGDLDQRRQQLQSQIDQRREHIQNLIREQYQQGDQVRLKLLLSSRSAADLDRMMHYYEGLSAAVKAQADQFSSQLKALATTNADIDANEAEMRAEAALLDQQQRQLEAARIKRVKTLARIDSSIDQKKSRMAQLNEDVARLQTLLEEINRSVDLLDLESGTEPFVSRKGKLLWPVDGQVVERFGSNRSRDGIVIAVDEGVSVQAVHPGRVVFSEWLRGYGLLVIVDHGKGYMTLYGHNQSLLRSTGAWVAAGDPIAVSGSSGGYTRPALYFSVRHKAKSVDPIEWLKRR